MIQLLINRYKQLRAYRYLSDRCTGQYAFVGIGQHSLTNLYPVLHHMQVPLKYICCTSEEKARRIGLKFPGVKATAALDEVLNDDGVKGVFVAAAPPAHFSIASQVLHSGKCLFIEKPPCATLQELQALIDKQRLYGSPVVEAGLQKRYAPCIRLLKKRLAKERLISYDLHYLTGPYPEGDTLSDLYIHPLDLAVYLFGEARVLACREVQQGCVLLMLEHSGITGTLELSTGYTWTDAQETLKVNTQAGVYRLRQMEELTYTPKQPSAFGIPLEKVFPRPRTVEYLYNRNNFTPAPANNQVYTQGYYDEIAAFVHATEKGALHRNLSDLHSLQDTYKLADSIKLR